MDKKEQEEAKEFVFNYTPKRYTKKYKNELNKYANILRRPLEEEQDKIYKELKDKVLGEHYYRDDARLLFESFVRTATPFNEAQTVWVINRKRVDMPPSFKRYRDLDDEIMKIPYYYSI
jgi:hypothetical protein